jgi:inorganic pyrophosphatase
MAVSGDIIPKERRVMSKVKDLESQIQELSPEELTAFREWFTTYDAGTWDQEFEADVKGGKLDAMAQRALRDHNAGRSTKL